MTRKSSKNRRPSNNRLAIRYLMARKDIKYIQAFREFDRMDQDSKTLTIMRTRLWKMESD